MAQLADIKRKFFWDNPPVTLEGLGAFPSRSTAYKMKKEIHKGSHTPYVRYWAEMIVEDIDDRDKLGEVGTVFDFIQKATRYANDPRGLEYIQTPQLILERIERGERPSLDCDDHTVLSLSLLRSLGYHTVIRVISIRRGKPYSHVYGLVEVFPKKWVPFDAVRRDKELGWETSRIVRKFDIKV